MRLSQRDPRRPALVTIGALATITGCSLLTSFQGLSSGDVIDGGGSPDGAAAEASDAGDASADADAHDASTRPRAWRQLPVKGPAERHSARMAYDELRKNVVLVGNEETWLWDGAAWSNPTIVSPSGRSVGLAYDNARQVTVLSGGTGTTNERWEWNGSSWSGFAGAAGPGNAYHPGLAYDRARKVLVAFGGFDATAELDKDVTWEWSPSTGYVQRALSVSPSGRSVYVMVYDTARSRVVLFGGSSKTGHLNDVWEYDGTAWAERTPSISPSPRVASCAAYDASRGVTVIFGGRTGDKSTALADTWEWDGTSWKEGPPGPPARRSCAMAYDAARDVVVMYGGASSRAPDVSIARGDTWIYE